MSLIPVTLTWRPGLPADEAPGIVLGRDPEGAPWLVWWSREFAPACFVAVGCQTDSRAHPIPATFRCIGADGARIVAHAILPFEADPLMREIRALRADYPSSSPHPEEARQRRLEGAGEDRGGGSATPEEPSP